MDVPPDIAGLRGSEFLDSLAQFLDRWAQYHQCQSSHPDVIRTAAAFMACHNIIVTLKYVQEAHIMKIRRLREENKQVFAETVATVDTAIHAGRSAFLADIRTPADAK